MRALEAARQALHPTPRRVDLAPPSEPAQSPPAVEQQRADALTLLAATALHHGLDPGAPGERYQVVVHVDAEALADPDRPGQSVLEDGVRVPAGTSSNLALICRAHHRAAHEEGYRVERDADGTLSFFRPNGELLPEVPASSALPSRPVDALPRRHENGGLLITARTSVPDWRGERLDVGYAIDVLHPLAT